MEKVEKNGKICIDAPAEDCFMRDTGASRPYADIEEQAQALFLRPVKQYAAAEGVTETLKADDPSAWIRQMNGIRNRANEVVMREIIYG